MTPNFPGPPATHACVVREGVDLEVVSVTTTTSQRGVGARIAHRLAKAVGPRRYTMWFDRSTRLDYDDQGHTLRVAVPNRFVAERIERHFGQDLRHAAAAELGADATLRDLLQRLGRD